MDLICSTEDDLKSLNDLESGSINIGASKNILHEYLMLHIKRFYKKQPNINIKIFTDKTSYL